MNEYIFTFGFNQKHEGRYHVVRANSRDEARDIMVMRFGTEWSMQYDSREDAGVERWGLKEIK